MKDTKNTTAKLAQKKAQLTIIEKLMDALNDLKKDTTQEYKVVGKEDKQATNWKTGELLWEDEEKTIPRYDNKWAYVEIPEEELTDEAKVTLQAIEEMKKKLDDMI